MFYAQYLNTGVPPEDQTAQVICSRLNFTLHVLTC